MNLTNPILVTGCAGFIGMHTCQALLDLGASSVIGVDNLNEYYDLQLKHDRLTQLTSSPHFHFYQVDIADREQMAQIWETHHPKYVINLAAQAGVRYSVSHPFSYLNSNIIGFLTILELCRHEPDFHHLIYASTSSVYGNNQDIPFVEDQKTVLPISLYAATKGSNELMAQSYYYLYDIPITGLRFFTVYGPWGRPDMAYFKFATAISEGRPIDIYNHGDMKRDFTYIDDIVDGILASLRTPPIIQKNQCHPIYNLGNHRSENLLHFIDLLEEALGKKAIKQFLPMQAGDVKETFADIQKAFHAFGYQPKITIDIGIPKFIDWFITYFQLNKPQVA
jgi:UDP-glucuronate 4-epimerase